MEASILFDTPPRGELKSPGVGEDFFGKVPTPGGENFPNSPPRGDFMAKIRSFFSIFWDLCLLKWLNLIVLVLIYSLFSVN